MREREREERKSKAATCCFQLPLSLSFSLRLPVPFLPFRSPFSPFLSPDGLVWTLQCQKWELLPRARRQCLPIGASQLCRISFSRRSPHSTSATLPSKKNFSKQALLLLHLRTFHFLLLTLQKTMKVAALIALVALALASFASGEYLKPFFWKEEIASRANPGRCFFFFFSLREESQSEGGRSSKRGQRAGGHPWRGWRGASSLPSRARAPSMAIDRIAEESARGRGDLWRRKRPPFALRIKKDKKKEAAVARARGAVTHRWFRRPQNLRSLLLLLFLSLSDFSKKR